MSLGIKNLYNVIEQSLSRSDKYLTVSGVYDKCEFYADKLKPLFSSRLERRLHSLLKNYVYSEYSDQVPLLNRLINVTLLLLHSSDELCVKNRPGTIQEDVAKFIINTLIRDGLISCFINSVVLDYRLNRIHRNFNYMGLDINCLKNRGIWNFIREKDYWINSDFTSTETSSSLQVVVDGRRETLVDKKVISGNSVDTRKALKRPASHDYPVRLEADEVEWIRSTSPESNEDFLRFLEENPCGARDDSHENPFCSKNSADRTYLACRCKVIRYPKPKQNCKNSKRGSRVCARTKASPGRGSKHSSNLKLLHKNKFYKDSNSHPDCNENDKLVEQGSASIDCHAFEQISPIKKESPDAEVDKPISYYNVIIEEKYGPNDKCCLNVKNEATVCKVTTSTNTNLPSQLPKSEGSSQIPGLSVSQVHLTAENESRQPQLEHQTLKNNEDNTSVIKVKSSGVERRNLSEESYEFSDTKYLISNQMTGNIPIIETDSVFDIISKLKLSPYQDPDENPQLQSDIQELLGPILSDRNQIMLDQFHEVSVHSTGMQTDLGIIQYVDNCSQVFSRCEENLKTIEEGETLKVIAEKENLKVIQEEEEKARFPSFKGSVDHLYDSLDRNQLPIRHCCCSKEVESDRYYSSSISKVFDYKSHHFDQLKTLNGHNRRPHLKKNRNVYSTRKKRRPRRTQKSSQKEYKHFKRSVIADFLCLPFTQVIRELVHKILVEKDTEASGDNNFNTNCRCYKNNRYSHLHNPDGFNENSNFPTKVANKNNCASYAKKSKIPKNRMPRMDHRLAGGCDAGGCGIADRRSKLQRIFTNPRAMHCSEISKSCYNKKKRNNSSGNSEYLSSSQNCCCKLTKVDDIERFSTYTRDRLTIYTHSSSTQNDNRVDNSLFLRKCHSATSSRCFSRRCWNGEAKRCIECDVLYDRMARMQNTPRCRTISAFPNENRSARYHSWREYKSHEPCHSCSDSSDKSGRRAGTERNAGSSSKCRSHSVNGRCSHRTKRKLSKFEFNGQQHVEPAINFDFPNKLLTEHSSKRCSTTHFNPHTIR